MKSLASVLVALPLVFATGLVLAKAPKPKPNSPLAKQGKELFQRYCATCHGTNGKGDGPIADMLKLEPADLTQISKKHGGDFPREEVAQRIDGRFEVKTHGPSQMPVWGERFAHEMSEMKEKDKDMKIRARLSALVTYLHTIQED